MTILLIQMGQIRNLQDAIAKIVDASKDIANAFPE
jgi:hypothetical protein